MTRSEFLAACEAFTRWAIEESGSDTLPIADEMFVRADRLGLMRSIGGDDYAIAEVFPDPPAGTVECPECSDSAWHCARCGSTGRITIEKATALRIAEWIRGPGAILLFPKLGAMTLRQRHEALTDANNRRDELATEIESRDWGAEA